MVYSADILVRMKKYGLSNVGKILNISRIKISHQGYGRFYKNVLVAFVFELEMLNVSVEVKIIRLTYTKYWLLLMAQRSIKIRLYNNNTISFTQNNIRFLLRFRRRRHSLTSEHWDCHSFSLFTFSDPTP